MLFSTSQPDHVEPPNRTSRAQCWTARDGYFGCLERNHRQQSEQQTSGNKYYFVPGEEPKQVCSTEREAYHSLCMKSWVEHFNKRIVNEQRSVATQVGLSKSRHPP
ncbi:hypothetical protein PGT21_021337 [Puccinia graminis f. sp. tritici]|uniref:Uncharacterized protein n=2 Tax=Puccinia graminis f. sp. tritici TaxID=56615 RepID=E3K4K6_PUCGT|nr:uncharacterized protein PGTG_05754 [Puccinia graminis f. sp. tritici CRL 75-36-700-3]EFP79433.1 hypothetical protein PGTG_05754 [Puccinia graminis f. sp. tritici CRL 75-36-700-3]KAA1070877.1 hypothetical protein PGT21_026351 [Puccinia graminis f. sp. tritici]KAA1103552.1 hypothetical protein PGT21_021337 [Puccinia graminis f. sp. tritici]KAA1132630.1 hypothetical protein PGTUg99_016958 [Puccinia graminis f. sp. tritici]